MPDAPSYRLPRSVVPRRYDLTLIPDIGSASFSGAEKVEVEVVEPVDTIVLNAVELGITDVELVGSGDTVLAGKVSFDEEEEQATIALSGTAAPGRWSLRLRFTGVLNDKLHGFYRSRFVDGSGVEHWIATTQFEATHARRAFPCWDEPDFKATFGVTLVVDAGLVALSNAATVADADLGDGRRRVQFAETMVMSTYLVAFVVGPFEATAESDVDGVPLRVVCPPGRLGLTDFALEIGAASLRFYAAYFGIPYPADKLDLIAIPDFAFGAMENLGAVTFRETALLADPAQASRLDLERVAQVVAHEIAHMWFGDLVTMRWWNGIWLNEAFATFMELLCVDDFRPQWDTWVGFGVARASAMAVDGLASTRPVEFPVGRPEEAEGMFDVLTYQKGCAVLRMLERHLGAEPFRSGIADYLARHSHANTETTDLWDAIEAASSEPARAVMDSWILQGGYPLVTVGSGGTDGHGVVVSQQRFRYLPDGDPDGDGDAAGGGGALWRVPVALRASVGGVVTDARILLTDRRATVELGGEPDWVVANAGGWGFYRVRYEPELLARITPRLDQLEPLERFNLVGDTWASVLAGHSALGDFLAVARLMGGETEPDIWTIVIAALRLIDKVVGDADRPALEAFVRDLAGPPFAALGWESRPDDGERTGQLRATLLAALGTIGADEAVRRRCSELHRGDLEGGPAVPPDLADAVVAVVGEAGGEQEYGAFLERFRRPATPQHEVRYLYGLARFADGELIERTLAMCLTDEVRTQNAPYVIGQLLSGRRSGAGAWRFLVSHWDAIVARFPDNSIPRMIDGLAGQASAELAGEAGRFFAEHPVPQELLVRQTLERMAVNAAFARRVAADAGGALDASRATR